MKIRTAVPILVIAVAVIGLLALTVTAQAQGRGNHRGNLNHQVGDIHFLNMEEDAARPPTGLLTGETATLKRKNGGATVYIRASGLEAGAGYTVWTVVFNNPEHCENGGDLIGWDGNVTETLQCGAPDLFNPDVEAGVFFLGGHVVGTDGKGNFVGQIQEGVLPTGVGQVPFEEVAFESHPLMDSKKADIHFVVRNHRTSILGLIDGMVNSFGGGCTPESSVPDTGPEGPNTCFDEQAVAFEIPVN